MIPKLRYFDFVLALFASKNEKKNFLLIGISTNKQSKSGLIIIDNSEQTKIQILKKKT